MAQNVGCVVVVLTKTVAPKSVVGGNDDEIHAKLKREVHYASSRITRTKYPFTVWMCRRISYQLNGVLHSDHFGSFAPSNNFKVSMDTGPHRYFLVIDQNRTGSPMLDWGCFVQIENPSEKRRVMAGGYQ
jgi:hypothetical protein